MAQAASNSCNICFGSKGRHYCRQCGQLFCENCRIEHMRKKTTNNHTFVSDGNINQADKPVKKVEKTKPNQYHRNELSYRDTRKVFGQYIYRGYNYDSDDDYYDDDCDLWPKKEEEPIDYHKLLLEHDSEEESVDYNQVPIQDIDFGPGDDEGQDCIEYTEPDEGQDPVVDVVYPGAEEDLDFIENHDGYQHDQFDGFAY